MPIKLGEQFGGNVLTIHCTGKVEKSDYATFVPEFERILKQQGKLRILFDLTGFQGWEPNALWEEVKFDVKHFGDMERIATVGDKKWEQFLAMFFKPFIAAKTRYFDSTEIEAAKKWLMEE